MSIYDRINELVQALIENGEALASNARVSKDIYLELKKDLGSKVRYSDYNYDQSQSNLLVGTPYGNLTIILDENREDNYISINNRTTQDIAFERIVLGDENV